jgi:hypothetical protein
MLITQISINRSVLWSILASWLRRLSVDVPCLYNVATENTGNETVASSVSAADSSAFCSRFDMS